MESLPLDVILEILKKNPEYVSYYPKLFKNYLEDNRIRNIYYNFCLNQPFNKNEISNLIDNYIIEHSFGYLVLDKNPFGYIFIKKMDKFNCMYFDTIGGFNFINCRKSGYNINELKQKIKNDIFNKKFMFDVNSQLFMLNQRISCINVNKNYQKSYISNELKYLLNNYSPYVVYILTFINNVIFNELDISSQTKIRNLKLEISDYDNINRQTINDIINYL